MVVNWLRPRPNADGNAFWLADTGIKVVKKRRSFFLVPEWGEPCDWCRSLSFRSLNDIDVYYSTLDYSRAHLVNIHLLSWELYLDIIEVAATVFQADFGEGRSKLATPLATLVSVEYRGHFN